MSWIRVPEHDHPHTHAEPFLWTLAGGLILTDIALVILMLLLIVGPL